MRLLLRLLLSEVAHPHRPDDPTKKHNAAQYAPTYDLEQYWEVHPPRGSNLILTSRAPKPRRCRDARSCAEVNCRSPAENSDRAGIQSNRLDQVEASWLGHSQVSQETAVGVQRLNVIVKITDCLWGGEQRIEGNVQRDRGRHISAESILQLPVLSPHLLRLSPKLSQRTHPLIA